MQRKEAAGSRPAVLSCPVALQVLHACTRIQPQPYRDEALLQALCSAAARRWVRVQGAPRGHAGCSLMPAPAPSKNPAQPNARQGSRPPLSCPACRLRDGTEQPAPQAVGMLVLGLGRLSFRPACQWDAQRGVFTNVLDLLCAALVDSLSQASPQVRRGANERLVAGCSLCSVRQGLLFRLKSQSKDLWPAAVLPNSSLLRPPAPARLSAHLQEICSCLAGLGLLSYAPQPVALCRILAHVSGAPRGVPAGLLMLD